MSTDDDARLTDLVRSLPNTAPFVGPEQIERARQRAFQARLGANETGFGPSPRAIAAMRDAAGESWKYGDPENYELRTALASFHGVSIHSIVVGEGIDGLLATALRLFAGPGRTVVTSDGAYPTFDFHVAGTGATPVRVPFRDDREDIDALLIAARQVHASVVYVSHPNNPMGSCWPGSAISAALDTLPRQAMLFLDEAYCDTAPAEARLPIDGSDQRLLRFRTFSKAYGLAGARIGYCIGAPNLIRSFEKVRTHYGVNRIGQIGALAALGDQDHLGRTIRLIAAARERIAVVARAHCLNPLPSAANFVAIDCGRDGVFATRLVKALEARDVFVRKPRVAPLDRCIRVSAGPDADLDVFAAALAPAIEAAHEAASP